MAMNQIRSERGAFLLAACVLASQVNIATADVFAAPGDSGLRHDLQLLNDSGVIDIPLTSWPLSWPDVLNALPDSETESIGEAAASALGRLRQRARDEADIGAFSSRFALAAAVNARIIRTFEHTPRDEGEVTVGLNWIGDRFTINLNATYVANPFDGDEFRPDGTYVGVALGNWLVTAGWQERWWGPGRDGSLILSNNARPFPAISIQRNSSSPFATRWLRWIGPWTLTAFMGQLDDVRTVNDALIFGLRGSIRPVRGLEIGISRAAQWCGDGRPCNGSTFLDLLVGNDNRGVNVAPEDEPGNQLAGIDIRWVLPRKIPVALYMQWIGDDSRPDIPKIGSWLRQLGLEFWGTVGGLSHRTHIEVADSTCRQGGFGFSGIKPDCAYEHAIYTTGYRYRGRSLAHGTDGDGLSYSIGSTLVQSAAHSWNVSLRYMEINRIGTPNLRHTLSATPQEILDLQISYDRLTPVGRLYAGIGYSRLDDSLTGASDSDVSGFIRWSSR